MGLWDSYRTPPQQVNPPTVRLNQPPEQIPVNKLYVASRDGSDTEQNRLYRYSFDGSGFTLDAGFPVNISGGGEETLTIAKDSTGKL